MRRSLLLLLLISVASCQYFDKKKVYTEDIVKEELETINWNDVDQYPSFSNCEALQEKLERKQCFETTLIDHVANYFSNQNIVVSEDIEDTLTLKIAIDKQGVLSLQTLEIDSLTQAQIPKLDSLVNRSLLTLPKIFPAIKRGQQVDTEFTLPIVIRID
ncbi:hypothetical protein [Winogradskyella sp. 3972H.M.0a.05]|uniref:hypothetical protein n=1 Tax=Winogradskyella sp. 3972H.M.0a.05 TaxID=2950277 RepID=UPI00339B10A9